MSKYTPGVWYYIDHDYGHDSVYGGAGRLVCHVFGDDAQAVEDARLIAAAPELLAALKECVRLFDKHDDCDDLDATYTARQVARAAIAKATGEHQ